MRAFKLMPLFSIIFVLGGQPLFPFNYAYAGCCAPCKCYGWCWCAGVNNCPKYQCHMDSSASLQAQALTNNERLDITGSYSSLPSPPTLRSYSIDRLIARTSSDQCDKNNVALNFFRTAEDRLKFEPDFLKYNASVDNAIVVSQMPLNEER